MPIRPLTKTTAGLILALFVVAAGPAVATTFQTGNDIQVSPLHQIDDDFFVACQNLTVEGEITGDLFAGASSVRILGTVYKSVTVATQYTDHNGTIMGSLRWMGSRLTINGPVDGSLVAMGGEVLIDQGAEIGRDAAIACESFVHNGVIQGGGHFKVDKISISGTIEGDVTFESQSVTVSPSAVIDGNVTFVSDKEENLVIEPGAVVTGEVTWKQPDVSEDDEGSMMTDIAFELASLLAAFLFGILMFMLVGPYAEEASGQLKSRLVPSFAAGLLTLIGLVLAVIILLLALVGVLIGTLVLADELAIVGLIILVLSTLMIPITSFATVSGAVLLYSGKIIVGLLVGCLFVRQWNPNARALNRTALFLGLIVLYAAAAIPYIGTAISVIVALTGAGAIILGIHNCRRQLPRRRATDMQDGPAVSE